MPELTREEVASWDEADPLRSFRDEFELPDGVLYLDGNSLGALPKKTAARLRQIVTEEWGRDLIRSWNAHDWIRYPRRVGDRIAKILGAAPGQVVAADSTSVNLFKLLSAAVGLGGSRTVILSEEENFPTDLYVAQGFSGLLGRCRLQLVPRTALVAAIDDDVAVVTLTHVDFRTGEMHDMRALTRLCHERGALALWDLSHSAGAVPLHLDRDEVDFAVGCGYKYLNGGPGAPAFLYVRRDLQDSLLNPIWGWFGQKGQFDLKLDYEPNAGVARFLVGTPAMLSLAAIEPGIDLLLEAGLDRLRAKSVRQTEYLIGLWEALLQPLGFSLNSPRDPERRGSHVSIGHPDALRIDQALIEEMNVLPDFRYPDNIRLGIAPIYTSFAEIHEAVTRICRVMSERLYEKYSAERPEVT